MNMLLDITEIFFVQSIMAGVFIMGVIYYILSGSKHNLLKKTDKSKLSQDSKESVNTTTNQDNKKYCDYCGTEMEDNAKKCTSCGAKRRKK